MGYNKPKFDWVQKALYFNKILYIIRIDSVRVNWITYFRYLIFPNRVCIDLYYLVKPAKIVVAVIMYRTTNIKIKAHQLEEPMKKLLIAATIATTVTLGACSNNPMSASNSYSDIVAQAKAVHKVAAERGDVWKQKKMKLPYVEYYLAKAEAAHKKGDQATAMKNAKLALKVAKAEVKQTEDYANITPLWARK